jgi:hypothetical protein
MTVLQRLQRGTGRRIEGVSTIVLHVMNIPARRDLRRTSAQLTRIERELRVLSQELRRAPAQAPGEDRT